MMENLPDRPAAIASDRSYKSPDNAIKLLVRDEAH